MRTGTYEITLKRRLFHKQNMYLHTSDKYIINVGHRGASNLRRYILKYVRISTLHLLEWTLDHFQCMIRFEKATTLHWPSMFHISDILLMLVQALKAIN